MNPNFNEEQQTAANAIDGVWVTVAGPGSGKTTVSIDRYQTMLVRGIRSRDILNLTFTSAAAEEMVKRAGLLDANKVFRTFHSFALDLIKQERKSLPFQLCDTVIPVALEDYKLLFRLVDSYKGIKNFQLLKEAISGWKRSNIEPEQALEEAGNDKFYLYACAYRDYERSCREEGWLDFDSLMRETVKLLETDPAVRARHQRPYIGVDEAQDTDIVQFRLLQLIFGGNMFVVGDENQLIYEWRSAQPGSLTNFERFFPGARKLYLGENFRSTGALVEYFREILPIDNGIASHMVTRNEYGIKPVFTRFFDDWTEAFDVLTRASVDPGNNAIIARTNRQLFVYQRVLSERGIKYTFLGKKDFWDQSEIKKVLAMAKDFKSDPRPAHEVIAELIRDHNLVALFRASNPDESDPAGNLNGLIRIAAKRGTTAQFLDYVRKVTYARKSTKKGKTVTLSTVHQAKGREWDHVFVVGVNEGKMPHLEGELAEEKRIYYVACSRAAKTLNISFNGARSQFINSRAGEIRVHTTGEQEE